MTFEERIGYAKCKYEYGGVSPDTVKEMLEALKNLETAFYLSPKDLIFTQDIYEASIKAREVVNKAEKELNTK